MSYLPRRRGGEKKSRIEEDEKRGKEKREIIFAESISETIALRSATVDLMVNFKSV